MSYPDKCDRLRSHDRSIIVEMRQSNFSPGVSPFQATQGHRNWHGSIRLLWFRINVSQQSWAYLVPFPR